MADDGPQVVRLLHPACICLLSLLEDQQRCRTQVLLSTSIQLAFALSHLCATGGAGCLASVHVKKEPFTCRIQ